MNTLKNFIHYYGPYKTVFFIDLLCAAIISLVDLAYPQILRSATKTLFTQDKAIILQALPWIAIGLFMMYVIQSFCKYYVSCQGHIMGAKMERDMRQELFEHYEELSFSYYSQNNSGQMMSKLVSDLFDISELAHHGPENLVISTLKILGAFAILCFFNIPMTMILLAVTVVMTVFSIRKNRKMHAVFLDNRRKIAGVNARVQDSLAGIRVVKSFANEPVEREKFGVSNLEFLDSKVSSYKLMGSFHAGNDFFQGLLYVAIIVAGGVFIARGTLEPAELAIYALYIGIFLGPVNVLINFTEQFQRGYSGFKRFLEVIETTPDIVDAPDAVPLGKIEGNIQFDNVSFHYTPDLPVLRGVSLAIPAGKTVALVGPSGGGKTTLCSLIPRFYDVAAGAVRIDGKDVRSATLRSLRSSIGIVQQEVYIFTGTLRENIAYGRPGASFEEVVEAAKKANIHDFIASLPDGYDTYAGERGTRLSGGQKQRISIARVFLKNPKILILDEATSALDNESERHIQAALEKLSIGRTTIVIAHRLSTIRNADEIMVVDAGEITERGTHEELLDRGGIYAKYYRMQFEGLDELGY